MKKYFVITYRLKKSVNPATVLQAIEEILQDYNVNYENNLFKMSVSIIEFEYEGVFHSNRKRNAILSICKKYPVFDSFFEYSKAPSGDDSFSERLHLNNCSDDYSLKEKVEYSTVREIVAKIPRPYSVNFLELVFNGICFEKENSKDCIRLPQGGFGSPVGNYILYDRYAYGDEKHSYVLFSAEKAIADDMRKLYFAFAEKVPGRYEETELQV